ncbi:esterase/lipase family protein [Reinekea sp.]|uniref:esterase/lipase family protein n=1 Tax=Reinekea sp. TaxID=1970455 RepID=UPI003988AD14
MANNLRNLLTVRLALWAWLLAEAGLLYWIIGDLTWAVASMLLLRFVAIGALSAYTSFYLNSQVLNTKQWLLLWLGEWWAFVLLFMGLQLLPKNWHETDIPVGQKHVILVHGFFCNAGMWSPLARRLERRGYTTSFVEMTALFGSLNVLADNLNTELKQVEQERPSVDISVVAFSMGGLAARYCLANLSTNPFRLITVHSPHKGTLLAGYIEKLGSRSAKQMAPGCDWLQSLEIAEAQLVDRPFTAIWSTNDTIVMPANNACYGHKTIEEVGKGHLFAVVDWQLHQCIFTELG